MPERIEKLQPNRTIALRGFDSLGAAAAVHSASANGFKVSGVFRDPADFAVLILHDADNFYEHPSIRYLPDTDFDGLTLSFDVKYSGLMPLDSPKFPTIDWPYLDVIPVAGDPVRVRLSDPSRFTQVGGTATKAQTAITIEDNGLKEFDRVTLWYLNIAYDYLVPKVECAYAFTAAGAGTTHTITVNGTPFSITEGAGETNTDVATRLADAVSASPDVTATRGDGSLDLGPTNQINLRAKKQDGAAFDITSTAATTVFTLHGIGAVTIASNLAWQINQTNWTAAGAIMPLEATFDNNVITVKSQLNGIDGNTITLYATSKNNRLQTTGTDFALAGGTSDAIFRCTLDFAALGIPQIRMMWFTYAPPIAKTDFTATEWEAEYTNWTLTGPEAKRALEVAGPDSVRIDHRDSWCAYEGANWAEELGFFNGGYARRSNTPGHKVTIQYSCSTTHDLWLGTSLYPDRAKISVRLDGGAPTELDLRLANEPAVNTRRRLRQNVPAGEHTVVLEQITPGFFYFDFLEAVVATDVPDNLPPRTDFSPALDYSTDHTYKMPPSRLMWSFDKLGFGGPMNEYIGVFWWNQRKRVDAVIPSATIVYNQPFAPGDGIFLKIGDQTIGKSFFPNEDGATVAKHFAYLLNATFVGVYAEATGDSLKVTVRSPTPAYSFTVTSWFERANTSTNIPHTGSLQGGQPGRWEIDETAAEPLNRGARDWHADLYAQCALRNREITTACSMELVFPPDHFIARFPGGEPVVTSVGFGNLSSAHCSFIQPMLDYQKKVYAQLAGLQATAGLTPNLQMGEFVWWFFSNQDGMAFYDDETKAEAQAALGRPLHVFRGPNDNPHVNGSADANFIRNQLRDYCGALRAHVNALYPATQWELLFPYDVNHPVPVGAFNLGGALNRYVNFAAEWESKPTSPFDRIKMEALDFGAWTRSLDLARTAIVFPLELGWPRDSVRYLVPVFRPGSAWEREYEIARGVGVPIVNFWAYDHFCLYNLRVTPAPRAARVAASD